MHTHQYLGFMTMLASDGCDRFHRFGGASYPAKTLGESHVIADLVGGPDWILLDTHWPTARCGGAVGSRVYAAALLGQSEERLVSSDVIELLICSNLKLISSLILFIRHDSG